eukprot:scaffold413_cov76-Skeletonema_dohrnii-CCMP3373.AAC.1
MSSTSTKFSIRWTDEVLLYILVHAKGGDFDVALETILRHEAAGQPPEELMRLLSGGRRHYLESSPSSHRRRRSYSESESETENNQNQNQSLRNDPDLFGQSAGMGGGEPVALNRNWRPSSFGSVPPSSSTLLLEGEGTETEADALRLSRPFEFVFERQQIRNLSENTHDMCSEDPQTGVMPASSVSSTAAVANSSAQTGQDVPLNRTLSERRQRHIGDVDEAELPKSKHQQMLYMQSGIEASLKETRKTAETNTDADDEDLSYAVKVSKETFDEEYRKQELRNELENRMIKISLAESLSDPVMKSEEELIDEALRKSLTLADTVEKSEELLLELARENSLKDMERIETIIKSEEELVEAAKQKSLLTMSKEEELIEAVKRQSLKSLSESVGKESARHASMPSNKRQSTSTTYPLGFAEDDNDSDISEYSSVEHLPPSRFDSLLGESDLGLLDRKMPALVLPAAENCEEDQAHDDNRLRAMSECSSSVQHSPPSRFDSSLLEDSDLGLLDRKMPAALVVPASSQNCGNNVGNSSRMNHPNVGSASSASADQITDKEEDSR